MKALVTGAGGFLGRCITEQLTARGDRVRAMVRRENTELARLGAECFLGDIRDRAAVERACQGMDTVFHVAAVAGIWGPWRHFYESNVLGTEHVIVGCLQAGVRRLVFTSSPSVTFAGTDQCGVDESVPYPRRWLAHYPHSKALAEKRVLMARRDGDLLACALRPHLIWGPGDQHLIPRLLDRARRGQLRQVGDGKNVVDAVYIENAAAAHLLAADALGLPMNGKAYFISNDEPVNCWDWINDILALAGISPVKSRVPLPVAYAAGTVMEGLGTLLRRTEEPRMTRFLAAQLGTSHYFDISAAKRDFGYVPKITMAEGMNRLGESLKSPSTGQV